MNIEDPPPRDAPDPTMPIVDLYRDEGDPTEPLMTYDDELENPNLRSLRQLIIQQEEIIADSGKMIARVLALTLGRPGHHTITVKQLMHAMYPDDMPADE